MLFRMGFVLRDHAEIEFQFHLAEERLNEAQLLFDSGYYNGTVSRAYYAMFAIVQAALISRNIQVKTHTGLRSAFGIEFIQKGIIDKEFGRILSRGEHIREEADYGSEKSITKDEAEATLRTASSFIQVVKKNILNETHII